MDDILNSDIMEQVTKEVKSIGETSKKNFEEINKNYEELKKLMDESEKNKDVILDEKIKKYTEDLITRQDMTDNTKSINDRIDQFETVIKRHGSGMSEEKDLLDTAMEHKAACIACASTTKNRPSTMLSEDDVNIEEYKNYEKSFFKFLRTPKEHLDPEDFKAMRIGVDPDGGYVVVPVLSRRVIMRMFEMDPIRQLCASERISTDAIEMLVDYDEADVGWEGEEETGAETGTPQINKKRIPVHVNYAKPRMTQTLIEDASINIVNWLGNKVANKMTRFQGNTFVSGNGVGKPRGFLTYDDYTTAGVDEYGKIEQIALGAAAALTTNGFIDLKYSLIEQYLTRGTWLMNRLTVAETMKLKDGDGQYIWRPGLQEGQPSLLLGLPLRMSTSMPVVAANALSVALADWAEAYLIVDRLGITIQRDPYTVKPFVEFYTRMRVGGDVVNYQAIKIGIIST